MPSSLSLYTTGNMEKAELHNSPAYDAGYPALNALDDNLDTYWKTASNTAFDVDLQTAKQVDVLLLFIKNYTTWGDGTSIDRYYSDNGSSWTFISGSPTAKDATTPIRISDTNLGISHRYWRVQFGSQDEAIKCAGIWWGRLFTIGQGNEFPESNHDIFANEKIQLAGNRLAVHPLNRKSSKLIERTWKIYSSTYWNALRNAHQDSNGDLRPLVINEGSSQSDALCVKFDDLDDLNENLQEYLFRMPTIRFRQIPYIDDGEIY